jgi:acyl-coenzyme A thioesterase PaaI-like protein
MTAMTADELHSFLVKEFPQADPEWMRVEAASHRYVRIRSVIGEDDLRPGGTVSAGTLATLADTSMYLAVLATIGPTANALATSLSIDFLRKPGKADLVVEAKILKLCSRLIVGDIALFSSGVEELVARASSTYSIPPDSLAAELD